MKTSTWILLGVGGYLLYRALQKTTTVSLPAPSATPLLSSPAATAQAVNDMINANLVAAGGTPGIV